MRPPRVYIEETVPNSTEVIGIQSGRSGLRDERNLGFGEEERHRRTFSGALSSACVVDESA